MPESLIDLRLLPLALFLLFCLIFIIEQVFYLAIFRKLSLVQKKSLKKIHQGVSVVICAHNEYHHLKENLPLILEQKYPEFEVVVVNHASDDDTGFLLARLEEKYPNLKAVEIKEDLNFFTGKKFPLSIGIKSARYDIILLTEAGCKPASGDWISLFEENFRPDAEIVLGYGAYNRTKGFLNKVIRFDTASQAIRYLSFAVANMPYTGVGRNLSYLKNIFYRNKGFISHYQIQSGEDELFINRVANRKNTTILLDPGSFTFSDPKQSFSKWISQKQRHLSTSTHYKVRDKILQGIYFTATWFFYCLFILLLSLNISVFVVLGLFFLRLLSQYMVMSKCMGRLNEKDLVPFFPVYELLLLLLNTGIIVSNGFRKSKKWK